jgi:hypothetical protein
MPTDRTPGRDDDVDGRDAADSSDVPSALEEAARDELETPADETDEG